MTASAVKNTMNTAEPQSAEIIRLATLSCLQYDKERQEAAQKLGVRVVTLDKEVDKLRSEGEESQGQGRALQLPEPKIWHESVDGQTLLSSLIAAIRRYVVLPESEAQAVALWVIHTYLFDVFDITPRLAIASPEKGCGKTTLLDVIYSLVMRPLLTANASVAVIFRIIEKALPSLLIDEAETFTKDNEELRGILNSGHRKGGCVMRTVGDDHEPRLFSTFCPLATALIGKLPDTLQDRAIPIILRRRRPDEAVTQFRAGRTEDLQRLASMAARWARDNRTALLSADPDMPASLYNRVADNWRPLLAIADVIGGEWKERARETAVKLSAGADTASYRTQLLADIKSVFEARKVDRIPSKELAEALATMEGSPWPEWRGKPLTSHGLANLLKPFGIVSSTHRMNSEEIAKGYRKEQFFDAWNTYLPQTPPISTVTSLQPAEDLAFPTDHQKLHPEACYFSETSENTRETATCNDVTVENPVSWENVV